MNEPRFERESVALVLITLLAVGIVCAGIALSVTGLPSGSAPNTVTATVQGPSGPTTITTTPAAYDDVEESEVGGHAGLKDESPTGATGLASGIAQQKRFALTDDLPLTAPLAAPQQHGCRTRMVGNKSSRNGVAPRIDVSHYTVSANRPGFLDINAITAYFDRPSTDVSSHYVIDRDGNCNYIVREVDKAWTQSTFNPVTIATEYIATGREPSLFTPRGLKRAARIKSDSLARWNIPVRRGKVSGCRVIRSGMVDHFDLGACGGGHTDVRPFKLGQLIRAVREYRAGVKRLTGPPTAVDRVTCRKLRWWRDNGRPAGLARDRANRRKAALTKRGIRCTARGPVRVS